MTNVATFDFVKHQYTNQANRKVSFRYIFSCASAKAERSLSSLYGVFLYVELGDPPPPTKISWVRTKTLHHFCMTPNLPMTKKTPLPG